MVYLDDAWHNHIPKQYQRLLSCISKGTSVRGLLQPSNPSALRHLQSYCEERINLRDAEYISELKTVMSELPAVWSILDNICCLENKSFLPEFVSRIIMKIIDIRENLFKIATVRDDSDYVEWDGGEHPTMCYPNLKLFRYPKKVKVNSKKDPDLCKKSFNSNSDFTAGIFSLGCACEFNTTLGFELMIQKESTRILYRLLMCRDIEMHSFQGILLDHACLFDNYAMNREAQMLKYKKVLVDGLH